MLVANPLGPNFGLELDQLHWHQVVDRDPSLHLADQ